MHTRRGSVQGYNAQAVTTYEQVIVAAELTQQANDLQQLHPMLTATTATLGAAGIPQRSGRLLADSGYWTIANLTEIPDAPELLIPPARHGRQGKPRKDGKASASKSDGLRAAMTAKLASADGKALYALRQQTVEPVSARSKSSRGRGGSWAGACRPRRRVEAAVRHPQPAQAVAAPDHARIGQPGNHLSRDPGRDAASTANADHPAGAAPAALPRRGKLLTTCSRRLCATGSYAVNR
jgi:hypothetical protein